jgi:hypothetical protein
MHPWRPSCRLGWPRPASRGERGGPLSAWDGQSIFESTAADLRTGPAERATRETEAGGTALQVEIVLDGGQGPQRRALAGSAGEPAWCGSSKPRRWSRPAARASHGAMPRFWARIPRGAPVAPGSWLWTGVDTYFPEGRQTPDDDPRSEHLYAFAQLLDLGCAATAAIVAARTAGARGASPPWHRAGGPQKYLRLLAA